MGLGLHSDSCSGGNSLVCVYCGRGPPRGDYVSVLSLHHVNLRVSASELQLLREFYCDALGLSVGWRPPFKSNGLWLYAGDIPIVHLVEATEAVPAIERGTASRFDHIAL